MEMEPEPVLEILLTAFRQQTEWFQFLYDQIKEQASDEGDKRNRLSLDKIIVDMYQECLEFKKVLEDEACLPNRTQNDSLILNESASASWRKTMTERVYISELIEGLPGLQQNENIQESLEDLIENGFEQETALYLYFMA